ncbi:LOW QUALITY PROTEIN: dnaJ homolog subfamily C member 13-like [Corticium candelabrum]|uniref:LOW QUALITY PROTEIN: dnaJ homolog subfamily C member 13-like n=1 Tax=Corticium candelabrum TaxID=121492 RepID=UPI002E26C2C9|nr:LOW QUALITY PROTEIN: dnaJ homolog subfamily C member 13-like [Corticium candelabrum]
MFTTIQQRLEGNTEVARYYATKHSWRGKYRRIFSVGKRAIATLNPATLEITNQWEYKDFLDISPSPKASNEFVIVVKKGKKKETMNFTTEYRTDLLTETLRLRALFGTMDGQPPRPPDPKFQGYKYQWTEKRVSVVLSIGACSLNQMDAAESSRVIASYDYKDIEGLVLIDDAPGAFAVMSGGFGRMHIFALPERDDFIRKLTGASQINIGETLMVRRRTVTLEECQSKRLGKYSDDDSLTSLAEFSVQKMSRRHSGPVHRVLCLTETCIVERDPGTYSVVTCRPLGDVFAIIRHPDKPQQFAIEYLNGTLRRYTATQRDSLLASMLDGVRASGNRDICVRMTRTERGLRTAPINMPVDEEVESQLMKHMGSLGPGDVFGLAVALFNHNVPYSGLLHAVTQDGLFAENKEKLINNTLTALLVHEGQQDVPSNELEAHFQALRRLFASKAGFHAFTGLLNIRERLGMKVVKALSRNNTGVTHAAVDMLCSLMQPMHDNYSLRQEQLNKQSLLSSKKFLEKLLEIFAEHVTRGTGALIISAMLDFLNFALCAPYSETTEGAQFDMLLEMVASLGRVIFKLFQHPSTAIVKGAGMLMKAIIEEGDSETAAHMQNLALAEGTLQPSKQGSLRQVEAFLMHWKSRVGKNRNKRNEAFDQQVALRKCRQRIKADVNWLYFYYQFEVDHAEPALIWNYKTREELKEALETEIRSFHVDKDLGGQHVISWNYQEFEVRYECLQDEIKIGDYYLRLLLEHDIKPEQIDNPLEFFNDLYHRYLLASKASMKAMCLQAMTIVYGKCHDKIGPFNDARHFAVMLEKTCDRLERDRLLQFLDKLLYNRRNVKELLDAHIIKILVDLATLAHLHTSRATVPLQTNVLEASPDMRLDTEKEWYYGNKEKERLGPFSFAEMKEFWDESDINGRTRCWAQGMDGWRPLEQVAQLKWQLMATGNALMNESEMTTLVLNMLIRVCSFYKSRDDDDAIVRPLPRCKRLLSDNVNLPHLVQLFVTFDPYLVEKLATLLLDIMQDNPMLPRLFQSGVFFFILMYTGSNVLPIARFLKYTHLQQAFRPDDSPPVSDLMQMSILGQIMPEAMVHFLENYGPEKFSEVFLGEFDTPETIWGGEMRRLMIEKIAAHLADFSPRLQSNTRAIYQYCSIPAIKYPQLENELFCNCYYLRHLCDTQRFPNWPIKEPIKLLKDILEEWKREVNKQPASMSVEEAYETLGLKTGVGGHEEAQIRKSYFKLAQKYHPDKNPDGREMFEAVNKAYEFLCSKSTVTSGPDPARIVLILRGQSILFKRYNDQLQEYKYSGYPMLIKTIKLETDDDSLFSKSAPLLSAAAELAFHTMNCSALNAEELRREGGIEVLQEAYARCVSVLSMSSTQDDRAVDICVHITRCYRVAAQFEQCREKMQENPAIISDLCRILYFKNLPKLNTVAVQCVSTFAVDYWLQTHLLQCGVLWPLLLYLFNYDYTLDESGVEKSGETNNQEVANNLAKISIITLARLAGYLSGDELTPENPTVQKSLRAMLTSYVCKQLRKQTPTEVLKILNSNTENPYLIWDNATRAELTDYVTKQQQSQIRTGECDSELGASFEFTVHKDELLVGEIFVRVYNEQPTFVLENSNKFITDLLNFLGSQAEYLHSLMALTASDVDTSKTGQNASRLKNSQLAMEALRNCIRNNPGSELQCLGHFKLIFSLLRMGGAQKLQLLALEVISAVTGNKRCVSNIAEANVLTYLLLTLHTFPQGRTVGLEILHALTSHTQIVKEALNKGALIYLLDIFCNSTNPGVRESAATLFAKMIADKLLGPKVRLILNKFLPPIFMDAMQDNPEASVHMFETAQENPELVWNDEAREKVQNVVKRMKLSHYEAQKDNPDTLWKLPHDFLVVYADVEGQIIIGGVILKLFIQQPSWALRRPKEFVVALMDRFDNLISIKDPNGEELETVTQAAVCLFIAQSSMVDMLPQLGHIPKMIQMMKQTKNDAVSKACTTVVQQIVNNDVCVSLIAGMQCIDPIMTAMKARGDVIATGSEALHTLFEKQISSLVGQALSVGLVEYLLELLESTLVGVESPSATKALIVKTLKSMRKDLSFGERVDEILEKSTVWEAYKDQKHDLFIQDTVVAGYLTGPVGVAGYLTAGPSSQTQVMSDEPPPMEAHAEDEELDE